MSRNRTDREKGAGIVEYALVVMLIAIVGSVSTAQAGGSVSDVFNSIFSTSSPTTTLAPQLTPKEKWDKAKAEYNEAIADAKATKAYDLAQAKYEYDQAVAANSSLPKAERNAANQEAKTIYNAAKADVNATYQNSLEAANTAKAAAKAEYDATK